MADSVQHDARTRLAEVLRSLRLDSGRSGEQLADALHWSQSKVSKIERGRTRPSRGDVELWARVCGASSELRAEALDLAEAVLVEARHWRASHHRGLAARQREMSTVEEDATLVRSFQPSLVPGLLQTAEYARQVLALADVSGRGDIGEAVAERLKRQAALYRETTAFEFVLTEAALHWHVAGREMLVPQIDRILSVSTLPNVGVRVLPLDEPSGQVQLNGFLLYEGRDGPHVVVETYTRELLLADSVEVDAYRAIHHGFSERALSAEGSHDFLSLLRARLAEQR